jgi:hypothetical protein
MISLFSFILYILLLKKLNFNLSDYELLVVISTSALIGYELAGVQYFINSIRNIIKSLDIYTENKEFVKLLQVGFRDRFIKSKIYYLIIMLVVIPFLIIDPIRNKDYLFSSYILSNWAIIIDLFNYIVTLLILSSMATILWIILNISFLVNQISFKPFKYFSRTSLFYCSDKVGTLYSIKNLILKLVTFQFIGITLSIITFLDPREIIYHEIIFLIILLIINIIFFLYCSYNIFRIFNNNKEYELEVIDQCIKKENEILYEMLSEDDDSKDINILVESLYFLNFLRNNRKLIIAKKYYELKNIAIFICTFFIPVITFIEILFQHRIISHVVMIFHSFLF